MSAACYYLCLKSGTLCIVEGVSRESVLAEGFRIESGPHTFEDALEAKRRLYGILYPVTFIPFASNVGGIFRIAHRELETAREGHWDTPRFSARAEAESIAEKLNIALHNRMHFWVEELAPPRLGLPLTPIENTTDPQPRRESRATGTPSPFCAADPEVPRG